MDEKITPEVFQKLVELASLELSEQEAEYLRQELNHQLISIEVLESIPIDEDVEVASHGVPYPPQRSPQPREDEVVPDPNREEILEQAPEVEDGYIVVPDISHEELE